MPIDLTVVIPCYNESRRIDAFFDLIRTHRDLPWEWLFVNDGSTDNTAALVEAFAAELGDQVQVSLGGYPANRGKGAAVRHGLQHARGTMVGYVDVDLAASPLDFQPFLDHPELRAHTAILAGIRLKTHDGKVKRLFYRHLMGRVFQTYVSNVTGLNVYDTQCGFKLMSTATAQRIAAIMQCDGFAFDVELLLAADRLGLTIREVPIQWEEKGDTKVRPKHIFLMALEILKIRRRLHDYRPPTP